MKLAFFLGSTPALSIADIVSVLGRIGARLQVVVGNQEVALIEVESGSDAQSSFAHLAGVVKIAEITARVFGTPTAADILTLLPATSRKIFFGISAYTLTAGAPRIPARKLGLDVKRLLEKEERSSRFVTSQEDALSAVVVSTNKLLSERGAEIVALSTREETHLGRTVWVQPYEAFAARDMGRPERDARVGMLPPKLAKMMVNLALRDFPTPLADDFTLIDPFCGSGTILQEASLTGVQKLVGTDKDGSAIKRTHENLRWLATLTPAMRASTFSLTLKLADVQTLPEKIGTVTVDALVTEPYLGPPQTHRITAPQARRLKDELEPLYRSSFEVFAKLLKPEGRVVMVWPVWRTGEGSEVFLDCLEDAEAAGLVVRDPLTDVLDTLPDTENGYLASRHSLLYLRENQYVGREIRIFGKRE